MTNLRNHVVSVLSIPFLYAGTAESGLLPARRHALQAYTDTRFEWESYTRGLSYLPDGRTNIHEQLATLHGVASQLLVNAIDVEPTIVAAVDEEFWNLI